MACEGISAQVPGEGDYAKNSDACTTQPDVDRKLWAGSAITGKPASDDLDRMRPIAACALDVEGLTQTCPRRAQVSRKDNIMDGQHQYIGDGVYASFDGWSVVLRANMPTTDTIFLEPEVAWALVEYIKRVYAQPEPESEQP